jgi:hypothetical protein
MPISYMGYPSNEQSAVHFTPMNQSRALAPFYTPWKKNILYLKRKL